jgi:hypothetical protein
MKLVYSIGGFCSQVGEELHVLSDNRRRREWQLSQQQEERELPVAFSDGGKDTHE